ncbi:hypothetical protein SK128_000978 [Halocaridina rubra]|uniref:Uncharacterized protein n=1 Tax=Halocaridina rubra TaxID=373956 RepID=A0AAN8XF58_HALRR
MRSLYGNKTEENVGHRRCLCVFFLLLLGITLFLGFFFAFYRSKELLPALGTRICKTPEQLPEYEGIGSFFDYLENPQRHCSSWNRIGNNPEEYYLYENSDTGNDVRPADIVDEMNFYVCSTEPDDEVGRKPCVVYAITHNISDNMPKAFLGCELHVFPQKNVFTVNETETGTFSLSSDFGSGDVAKATNSDKQKTSSPPAAPRRHVRDVTVIASNDEKEFIVNDGKDLVHNLSLEKIVSELGHQGQTIRFLRVDSEESVRPVLEQIVALQDLLDVQQVSTVIRIPSGLEFMSESEKHLFFAEFHKVFENLHCLGYRLINSLPIEKDRFILPELENRELFGVYNVNWIKISHSVM